MICFRQPRHCSPSSPTNRRCRYAAKCLERALEAARTAEVAAEAAVREGVPRLAAAQETWYSLAALKERVASTLSIARERMRQVEDDPGELLFVRDPDELEREAARVAAQEHELANRAGATSRGTGRGDHPSNYLRGRASR